MALQIPEALIPIPNSMIRESLDFPWLNYKDSLPGIDMIEAGGINSAGYDCSSYAFANEKWFQKISRMLLFETETPIILEAAGYQSVSEPTEGDTAMYLTYRDYGRRYLPVHYGRVVVGGLIESKFGEDNAVFRHAAAHVPKIYGEFILFLTKIKTDQ